MRREIFEAEGFKTSITGFERTARYRTGLKQQLDVLLTGLSAPLWLPLIGLLWCLVRLDGGPGFFGHRRVGRDGVEFRCWKLRTMVPDAEKVLRRHLAADPVAMREWQRHYKLRNDPRITRIGRFLRRSSLDELPQLFNVLKGEMSLVGPRPVPRDEFIEYCGYERAYLACRPGLTGLWQVSGRNDTSYAFRIRSDVNYARRAALLLDLWILVRTVGVVLRMSGR